MARRLSNTSRTILLVTGQSLQLVVASPCAPQCPFPRLAGWAWALCLACCCWETWRRHVTGRQEMLLEQTKERPPEANALHNQIAEPASSAKLIRPCTRTVKLRQI